MLEVGRNNYALLFFSTAIFLGSCKSAKIIRTSAVVASGTVRIQPQPDPVPFDSASYFAALIPDTVTLAVHRLQVDTSVIIGVGDMMLGTNYPEAHYLPPDSGKYLLQEVSFELTNADVTFGNLEGVILNDGGSPKKCRNPKLCYVFRSPEYMVNHFVQSGFDILSVANNHSGDFGEAGRNNTAKVLDSAGLHYAGSLANPYTILKRNHLKYGFAAFSPNSGTVSIHNLEEATKIVEHLDSVADIVVISFHGGAEGAKYQNVNRKTEIFYGENRGNVYKFAHTLIDAGADVIFGHGPHVTRAIEVYKNRFIAYSLGNFATYGRFNLRGDNGIAPMAKIFTDNKGEFLEGMIIPIVQVGRGIPKIDEKKRVIKKLQKLMVEDFPESIITLDDTGKITYLQN